VLISPFSVDLKLGHRHWLLPLRLPFLSMALIVGPIAIVRMVMLGFTLGTAGLLVVILAQKDPVFVSAVHRGP
jgi:hypothetical protein